MTAGQKAFFELVRAGLWRTGADFSAFDGRTNWDELFRYGKNQALLGIMLDGIQSLPDSLRPDRSSYLRWCAVVLQIEDSNKKLNRAVGELYALLRAGGIEPVLLKGQGAARNYPEPLHRQCGDIDIYIGEKDFERVNALLREEGRESHEANFKHCTYTWHDVMVENHRILGYMKSPKADRILQKNVASWYESGDRFRFDLEGCEVAMPPLEFDAVFLLQHSVHHLLNMGIGFRQVCDWACLLHNNRGRLDKEAVVRDLQALGLDKAARVFGALAVRYLGLAAEDLLLPFGREDEEAAEWLMDEIWRCGDFGWSDTRKKTRPQGYWRSKWYTFTTIISRYRDMRRIAPSEAFWTPLMTVVDHIKSQIYVHSRRW